MAFFYAYRWATPREIIAHLAETLNIKGDELDNLALEWYRWKSVGTLAYSRKQTDQDGGIHSQEYTNYQSFA
ncbi:hypothetical protein CFF01_02880 [Shewanella marisflavi]|uniref:Uncharacterized protein n=1 Tax=Shewanella marisflavi TaxID=260364 RepID=A0AAC9TXW5_9GAMM|nr:hypothetical protein CFF01_02880 [Shewanella marisflavi]